jgi:hypothetical protein
MVKRVLAILFIVFVLVALTVTCSPDQPNKGLIGDIFQALAQIAMTGLNDIDLKLEGIYQDLYETEERIIKLEQVMRPALDWVESQKSIEHGQGNWLIKVKSQDLTKLNNDQYIVTIAEVYLENSGTPNQKISSEIKVLDRKTGTQHDAQFFESTLRELQNSLKQQEKEKLAARSQLISTINDIFAGGSSLWKIRKAHDRTYIISAPNLGWAGRITDGEWKYDLDTRQLSPFDNNGTALKNLLSGSS